MNFQRINTCQILAVALITVALSYTSADEITLIPEGGFATGANVNALAGPLFASDLDSVDLGGSGMASASAALSGNSATHDSFVELDFSAGGVAFFESSYSAPFVRTDVLDHRASAESIFHFAVDVPTAFDVMGFLEVTDEVGTTVAGNVELEVELLEFDAFGLTPEVVFYNYQVSKSTIDQAFVVGGMDGDTTNALTGDAFGILDPSKVYLYRTLVTSNAIDIDGGDPLPATDGGASLVGMHSIVFSAPSAIPEPGSAALIGLMLTAVALRRQRI